MRAGCGHEERAVSAVVKRAVMAVMPARVVARPAGVMPAAVTARMPRASAFGNQGRDCERNSNRGYEWTGHGCCARALKVGPAGNPAVQYLLRFDYAVP